MALFMTETDISANIGISIVLSIFSNWIVSDVLCISILGLICTEIGFSDKTQHKEISSKVLRKILVSSFFWQIRWISGWFLILTVLVMGHYHIPSGVDWMSSARLIIFSDISTTTEEKLFPSFKFAWWHAEHLGILPKFLCKRMK